jgi:hypothetical protein
MFEHSAGDQTGEVVYAFAAVTKKHAELEGAKMFGAVAFSINQSYRYRARISGINSYIDWQVFIENCQLNAPRYYDQNTTFALALSEGQHAQESGWCRAVDACQFCLPWIHDCSIPPVHQFNRVLHVDATQ